MDIIFNFAGQVSRLISLENPELDIDINVKGSINVLEAVKMYAPDAKVIFAGSRGQTGEPLYLPVDEEHPDNPTDISKYANKKSDKSKPSISKSLKKKNIKKNIKLCFGKSKKNKTERRKTQDSEEDNINILETPINSEEEDNDNEGDNTEEISQNIDSKMNMGASNEISQLLESAVNT